MSDSPVTEKIQRERPLSPHLQIYRLPYNARMSIVGRGVGVLLSLVLIALCTWFTAVVWNPEIYNQTMVLLDNPYTKYAAIGLAFLVFFYLGNGVRHVLWDMGVGVNEKSGVMTGNIVLLLSVLLTFGLWQASCGCWTGYFSSDVEILEGTENVE